ncbi:MAG: hypothetical protein WBW74_10615 [Xanthobacteraceae bacterium]
MRKWAPRLLTFAIVLCAAPAAADNCSPILKDGLWQSWDKPGDIFQREDFKLWACDSRASRADGAAPGKNEGRFDDKSSNCATTDKALVVSDDARETLRIAAEAVVAAWKECSKSPGSHAIVLRGDDVNSFAIQLVHNRSGRSRAERPRAWLTFDPPDNVECRRRAAAQPMGQLARGIPIGATLTCERKNLKKPVNVTVEFNLDDSHAFTLPAVRRFKEEFRFERIPADTDCRGHDIPNRCHAGDKPRSASPYCDAVHRDLVAICYIPGVNANAALPERSTSECRAMGAPQETPWCSYKDVADCRGGRNKGPAYRCVRVLVPDED